MKRVTGIGGVFLKAADPERLHQWYEAHLGLSREAWGGVLLRGPEASPGSGEACTVFAFFPKDTTHFAPSPAPFMINFRVQDLEATLAALQREGVAVEARRQQDETGKFAWLQDPEGNRIELWEPPPGGQGAP
jgi:predicted enzyme related to lactoylglutathione lyase